MKKKYIQTVTIDSQGVLFGKHYWVSHEAITGCDAADIPTKKKQYWEWVQQAKETFGNCPLCKKPARVRNAKLYCPRCKQELEKTE